MEPKCSVYKIIEIETGKIVYVGQHWYNTKHSKKYGVGPNDSYMGSGLLLKRIYKKYGKDKFKKELISYDIYEQKDADLIEELFIKEYNTISPNGYNLKNGGLNSLHSEETKNKLSIIQIGKIVSDETRIKMSEASKGKPKTKEHSENIRLSKLGTKTMLGKKQSDKQKQKLSKLMNGNKIWLGRKHSEESKEKMKLKRAERKPITEETREKMRISRLNYLKNKQND